MKKLSLFSGQLKNCPNRKKSWMENLRLPSREETGSLIEEVNAQRDALDQRISALHDGLKVSSDLVDTPVDFLEDEIAKINDKLEIAQERLQNLEQEQYLEELGRKLNRSHDEELSEDISQGEDSFILEQTSSVENFAEKSLSLPSIQQEPETTQTMATTSNRIESEKLPLPDYLINRQLKQNSQRPLKVFLRFQSKVWKKPPPNWASNQNF